jgi:hypothetical protein
MNEVNHSQRKHALFSASASERWLTCPASVLLTEDKPNPSSDFAREGTCAHEVADLCLRNNQSADEYIGKTLEGWVVTEDMAEHVQSYLDYVRSFKGELFPETRVDFSNYIPDGFGTSDAIIVDHDNKHLHVLDLKFGMGIPVYAEGNTQGQLYAIGTLNDFGFMYDIEKVSIHIVQPRIGNFSSWEIAVPDLIKFAEYAKAQAEKALQPNPPFQPTESGCRWCLAKATCKALAKHTFDTIVAQFDEVDLEIPDDEPSTLTDHQIALIIANTSLIKDWLESIHTYALSRGLEGEPIKGYKVVEGRSVRKYTAQAEEILEQELGDKAFQRKLKGVTEIDKLLGKGKLEELGLVEKPQGKPTLVREDDKREPFSGNVADMFDEV